MPCYYFYSYLQAFSTVNLINDMEKKQKNILLIGNIFLYYILMFIKDKTNYFCPI